MESSMPRSCGLTLRTFRTRKKLKAGELTELLRPHTVRFKPKHAKFSDDTISRAEHSEQTLYWTLDAYAKWSGYPVGLIYLFARISSELRDGDFAAAGAIAQALKAAARFIETASPQSLGGLQPIVLSARGLPKRPTNELDAIAYDTVIRFQRYLPENHPEYSADLKYTDSDQFIDDARQVRILLEILSQVPPPFGPGGESPGEALPAQAQRKVGRERALE